jgi:SH2 domain/BPS (Between PH and SH2)
LYAQERLQAHHAAMDFTGAGGRIVTDPREAAEIAHTESRLRPVARAHWTAASGALAAAEDPVPLTYQPWFKPGVSRDQASLALLPHRSRDGVFVIRECSRGQGGFVLSFTTQGKVVHAQIVRVSS